MRKGRKERKAAKDFGFRTLATSRFYRPCTWVTDRARPTGIYDFPDPHPLFTWACLQADAATKKQICLAASRSLRLSAMTEINSRPFSPGAHVVWKNRQGI